MKSIVNVGGIILRIGDEIVISDPDRTPFKAICIDITHNGKLVHFELKGKNGLETGTVGAKWVKVSS